MSGNTIGRLFCVTTFGESHGPAPGAIVDGCPPGLELSEADLQRDLELRRAGTSRHTKSPGLSPRGPKVSMKSERAWIDASVAAARAA